MRRLLQEPLLHFLILGALLFGLYSLLQGGALKAADEIVVSRGQVQSLEAQFQRTRQRAPTSEELQGLVDSWVREEIFYREGLAMGLDRDDPIVRRRVAQKLEFIADGTAPTPPTAAELQAWLDAHPDKYQIEPRYTLRQIYFDVARHGEKLDADVAAVRRALDAGKAPAGDPTLLPQALDKAEASEVKRVFGKEFADALKALPVGIWQGPLRSGFGVHLVKLSAIEAGRRATLDEARAEVERDLLHARSAQSKAAHYEKLRARYTVRIDSDRNGGALKGLVALLLACLACAAQADVFRPAYLELREAGQDRYDVMWKVPAQGDARLAVEVVFPPGTTKVAPPRGLFSGGAYVERWQVSRPGGLAGQTLAIDGIAGGVTDVIVRVERSDGTSQVEHLLPQRPQFTVKAATGTAQIAWSYLVLGVEHILGGVDHLLFVLALLLIVRGGRRIVATITAFTLAHSLTLVAATLGWVHVPGPPVEAMIALSIVFVAAEVVHGLRGRPGLTARAPWVVAFSFGLLHGFGFAGALAEVGSAADGDTGGPAVVQRRSRNRPADVRGLRDGRAQPADPFADEAARVDAQLAALLHRHRGDVLGHRAHRRILLSNANVALYLAFDACLAVADGRLRHASGQRADRTGRF